MTDTPKATTKKAKPVVDVEEVKPIEVEVVEATPQEIVETIEEIQEIGTFAATPVEEPTLVEPIEVTEEPKKVPFVGDERKFHGAQYGQSWNSRVV
jgi:hypothetical protein